MNLVTNFLIQVPNLKLKRTHFDHCIGFREQNRGRNLLMMNYARRSLAMIVQILELKVQLVDDEDRNDVFQLVSQYCKYFFVFH